LVVRRARTVPGEVLVSLYGRIGLDDLETGSNDISAIEACLVGDPVPALSPRHAVVVDGAI